MSSLRSSEAPRIRESTNTRTHDMGNAPHRAAARSTQDRFRALRVRIAQTSTDGFVRTAGSVALPLAAPKGPRSRRAAREPFLVDDPSRRAHIQHTYERANPDEGARRRRRTRGGKKEPADMSRTLTLTRSRPCHESTRCSEAHTSQPVLVLALWLAGTVAGAPALPTTSPPIYRSACRKGVRTLVSAAVKAFAFLPRPLARVRQGRAASGGRAQGLRGAWGLPRTLFARDGAKQASLREGAGPHIGWGIQKASAARQFERFEARDVEDEGCSFDAPRSECNMAAYVRAYGTPSPPGSAEGVAPWRLPLALA
ncbi:hypothetical protein V8D89_001250 [Ganoderma adspersum]